MFHVLFYMLESEKADKAVFKDFFTKNSDLITQTMLETLNYYMSMEETYLVERDTLVVSPYLTL